MDSEVKIDKIKETLIKVKSLADKGIDGEKQSAQKTLEKLLKKYKLSIEDIGSTELKERVLKYNKDSDAPLIMVQVISSVSNCEVYLTKSKYLAHAKLTNGEYVEVVEKYKYYWKLFKTQRTTFRNAFIKKNKLYPVLSDSKHYKELSQEEMDDINRMMVTIKQGEFEHSKIKGHLQ